MLFLEWLLDQKNEGTDYSAIADIVWTDIYLECLTPVNSLIDLQEHWRQHHSHMGPKMAVLLKQAFDEYADKASKP